MRHIDILTISRNSAPRLILWFVLLLLPLVPGRTQEERRVALVIGNGAYANAPLINPLNDARDMAEALSGLGFEVVHRQNLGQNEMKRAIRDFGGRIRSGGVGLFYYAGHGVQVGGRNFLIPIGATITKEAEVEYESVDLGLVLAQIEEARNRLNILILDACRDNPFARSFRSGKVGLAKTDAPVGTLVAYATAPGSVASDGDSRNGLYTRELLRAMQVGGLKVEEVFKRVRTAVRAATNSQQVPWESSSLEGDFYFRPPPAGATPVTSLTVERERVYGEISVTADRSGAEVFLDGRKVGYTEAGVRLRLRSVPAGEHTVTASLGGRKVFQRAVHVEEGSEASVQILVLFGPKPAQGGTRFVVQLSRAHPRVEPRRARSWLLEPQLLRLPLCPGTNPVTSGAHAQLRSRSEQSAPNWFGKCTER